MKHFIYFSKSATTSGKALSQGNLMKAGRIDIAIHSFIQGVFLSHDFREDVKFHFVFYGMPDPPKHIEIRVTEKLGLNKRDIAKIIQKLLYKYKPGEKNEVLPGCFIEKKPLLYVVEELAENSQVFLLDKKGKNIRNVKISKNPVFILGDQDGLPKKELKRLKKIVVPVSVGSKMYFSSQVIAVINNELDFRGI
ncbi:MAG: hypothetical protein KKF48_05130 [Nanoarchaeota archaeon]|nr:hypothetical protein [Nanoarchaeota archaeon]MBU1028401.1 hypothetical protein [Nanoarchaeota archaeon]